MNQFYPPDSAATGQLLADLAMALAARGQEVHVLASRRSYGGGERRYRAEDTILGVRVHRVGASGFGRGKLLGRLVDYFSFYVLAAWRVLTLPRMDVCVCLTTPPFIGLVGLLLKAFRGTRLVLWTMDLYPEVPAAFGAIRRGGGLYRLLARIARGLYGRATCVVSLGEVMTERLVEAGAARAKIATVDNWVPGESVRPIDPAASMARRVWGMDGHVTLMYSGNLGLGHELDTAVRAVARLKDDGVVGLFVGNGKARPGLEGLARELGAGNVRFLPPQPLDCLADSLAAGDIHLVSQKPGTEGLMVPSKIYGILAAGRPVVYVGSPDTEVARIVSESGAGFIVPPSDVDAMTSVVRRLAADASLRSERGRQARRYYEERLGMNRSVGRIVQRIESAAGWADWSERQI